MSTTCFRYEVEFIGGPIDGHTAFLAFWPDPFVCASTRSGNYGGTWIRKLWERIRGRKRRTVDVYELDEANGRLRYRHCRAQSSPVGKLPHLQLDVGQRTEITVVPR